MGRPRGDRGLDRRTLLAGLAGTATAPWLAGCATASGDDASTWLITGGTVLTMDGPAGPDSVMAEADVLVRGNSIVQVASRIDGPRATRIDARGGVVMPGFVDTHWHLWNSLARGLDRSAKGGFAPTMGALARVWTPEASALGVRLGLAEAVDGGITCVANWAHNTRSPAHARAELAAMQASGVRGRFCYGYPNELAAGQVMDVADLAKLKQEAFAGPPGRIGLGVCVRGPERSDETTWRREWAAARELGLPLTTHIAVTREAAAKGAIATLARDGLLGRDIQLVHATHASDEDFARIAAAGSPLCLSPWTELEVGYGIPPIARAAKAGVRLSLSVDNLVLSGRADMFSVMKLTADIAAGSAERQGAIAIADVVRWATRGGADDLGLADRVGALTPGRRADLIVVRGDRLGTAPGTGWESLLTRGAQPADVDFVMIDGVVHKQGGRLTRVDTRALLAEATAELDRLRRAAGV